MFIFYRNFSQSRLDLIWLYHSFFGRNLCNRFILQIFCNHIKTITNKIITVDKRPKSFDLQDLSNICILLFKQLWQGKVIKTKRFKENFKTKCEVKEGEVCIRKQKWIYFNVIKIFYLSSNLTSCQPLVNRSAESVCKFAAILLSP